MRIIAIIVNLVQIGIILTVFLSKGMALGSGTVVVFFLLLLFAFINLLVLLFYTVNIPINPPLFGEEKPGIVKRQDVRVSYRTGQRPIFLLGDREVQILDLAEKGARFSIPRGMRIKKRVRGEIALLCGKTIKVKGQLHRREGDEATLVFKTAVSQDTLMSERRMTQSR
jgi:hypothetical protein